MTKLRKTKAKPKPKTRTKIKISIVCSRLSLESHDQSGETAVLRGAGPLKQDPLGEISQLQVQAAAQENLHHRWQEAPHRRVQADDAVTASGDEAVLCGVSTTVSKSFPWTSVTFFIQVLTLVWKEAAVIPLCGFKIEFQIKPFYMSGPSNGSNVKQRFKSQK